MSDRDQIFSNIRQAIEPIKDKSAYPEWDYDLPLYKGARSDGDWDQFVERFSALNGVALKGLDALGAWLKEKKWLRGYCDPWMLERIKQHSAMEGIELLGELDRNNIDDYQFGITRASGVIAESGTIVLKDAETSRRLAALAPWAHIAILAPDRVLPHIPAAIEALGDDPSVIWVTGPSKTADIEGILIEGVHGPGVQACCLWNE